MYNKTTNFNIENIQGTIHGTSVLITYSATLFETSSVVQYIELKKKKQHTFPTIICNICIQIIKNKSFNNFIVRQLEPLLLLFSFIIAGSIPYTLTKILNETQDLIY